MKARLIAAGLLLAGGWWLAIQPITAKVAIIAAVVLAGYLLTRLAIGTARFALASRATRGHYLMMIRARLTWRRMTRHMGLAGVEPAATQRPAHEWAYRPGLARLLAVGQGPAMATSKIMYPKVRIKADDHGLVVDLKTTARTGRVELEASAEHLCDYWRVHRLQIIQPEPGRVVMRALRIDPLSAPIRFGELPSGVTMALPGDTRSLRLLLGRDEFGEWRYLPLSGVTGMVVAGLPGSGKSNVINSWLVSLAASAAVEFVIIDGKGSEDFDLWERRATILSGDDLADAVETLGAVHALMMDRKRRVTEMTGKRNMWHAGPTPAFPLVITVIDECQTFFDLALRKGDRELEPLVRKAVWLTGELIRKGRSLGFFTIVGTQKATGASIPTDLRDNCALSVCFAVKTTDAAIACLGEDVRQHPSLSPVKLQGPENVGVAVASLRTGLAPFTRIRAPEVTDAEVMAAAGLGFEIPAYPTPPGHARLELATA